MLNGIPLTNYQIRKIKFYLSAFSISALIVMVCGNIITALITDSIKVNRNSYVLRDGFPMFTSGKDYIRLIRNYPHNPGCKLRVHRVGRDESFWNICLSYGISIDTLIAANPFLESLSAVPGTEIVIPMEDGVLFAFDDMTDVSRMSRRLEYSKSIRGDYRPSFFRLISRDDIRLVFFRDSKPDMVNTSLEKLYRYRQRYQSPVYGPYTSLFGDRVDPIHHGMSFHNGVDINSRYGNKILPMQSGYVVFTGWRDGYGKTIIIQHDRGYTSLYGHCSKIFVKKGDLVKKETVIGLIGSTGRSTGPHLHFTVTRHGKTVDPLLLIW